MCIKLILTLLLYGNYTGITILKITLPPCLKITKMLQIYSLFIIITPWKYSCLCKLAFINNVMLYSPL